MAAFSKESASTLDGIASRAMEKAHAPSVSLTLIKGGEVVYSKAYGARDRENNRPATPDTLYGIGSCTKSFICLSILQLAEEGKLSVRDPIGEYLPVDLGHDDSPITLHHLMSHGSGYPSLGTADIMIDMMSAGEGWIPMSGANDFYEFINAARDEVDGRPGERYYYLNAGYTLLGYVVEEVSGVSLEDYLRKHVWGPLGMDRTTLLRERFDSDPDTMTAYWKQLDGSLKPTVHPFHEVIYAPGGILSSTHELVRYLEMYLGGGEHGGTRLIGGGLMEEMFKPHSRRPPNLFGENHYGYGWGVHGFRGHRLITHTGSTGVSAAYLGFVPYLGIAVAYLSNVGYWSGAIPHSALALLMGEDPLIAVPYLRWQEHASKLEGTYSSYRDIFKISVVPKGNLLYAEAKDKWMEMSLPMIPLSDDPEETEFWVYASEGGRMKIRIEDGKLYWERWILHKS